MNRELRKLLYVDDEPDIREIVEMSLSLSGELTVQTCASGAEALAKLPQFLPDLVLLDVMMPTLDGPATFAKMREQADLSDIPVIFMTAKALPQEVDRFIGLGAIGVISKPFDPMRLAERVADIWRETCGVNA